MTAFTWLHLSDLHFRSEGERKKWDQNIVLTNLLKDVTERIKEDGLRPNLILISGDIAFSGRPQEYDLARQFLDKLLMTTGISKQRLFIVPGNHDVNRAAISRGSATIAQSLKGRDDLAETLADEGDRRSLMRKLDAYAGFVKDYFGGELPFDDEHHFYVRNLDLADRRVAVLGLNSAWLSMGDQDLGKLALGEQQVRQALEAAKGANLRIALMHHPFDWFWEFDRTTCEALLTEGCDFILHGHLHRSGVLSLKTPDAGAMILAAGACYETRQYPNAYNWVHLDLEAGQGTIYLRKYSDERGGFWTKDVMTYKNVGNGEFIFSLPSQKGIVPKREKRQPSLVTPIKLEASYLRRMQTVCNALPLAIIDPRAVERTMQKTMDLVPLYVALNTKTQLAVIIVERKGNGKPRELDQMVRPGLKNRPMTALEAAAREQNMVLLGDPGSGKSTFANYLALCLAGARLEHLQETGALPGERWLAHLEPAWTHGPLLPLQVILRQFAKSEWCDGTSAGLRNFVEETLAAQGLSDFVPHLFKQLFEGGVIVILDGLDEVADPARRQTVRDAVLDFAATHNHPNNHHLVTCRGYAYQDDCCQLNDFAVYTLAPFNQDQIDSFIGCWYGEVCRLGWKTENEAQELTQRLRDATRRPDLAPLAKSPLQLAMMASLHFSWGRLPDDRVELYQEMVRLLLVRWQEARLGQEAGVTQSVSTPVLESALERVAYNAHLMQAGSEGAADIGEEDLLKWLKDFLGGKWERANELVTYIRDRAGLLIDKGKGMYTFPHRSYQEYLAGSYLAVQQDFPYAAARLARENYKQWREVLLWAVGALARLKRMTYVAVGAAEQLCQLQSPGPNPSEIDWRLAQLSGEELLEIGLEQLKTDARYEEILARVQKWLVALVERGVLFPPERAAAGRTLSKLGDPRQAVVTIENMEFCFVPDGPFWMGEEEKKQVPNECLNYGFWISRYPITNGQYHAFVDANGYCGLKYWREAKDAEIWKKAKIGRGTYRMGKEGEFKESIEEADRPYDFGEPFNLANHPVVGICWYEALAFGRWLNDQRRERLPKNYRVQLPSEAEWEKAARGGLKIPDDPEDLITRGWELKRGQVGLKKNPYPKRLFPWEGGPDSSKANYDDSRIGSTSAVGCFPGGASPYGALDMSGNAWEWTRSAYKEYPYDPKDGREDLKAPKEVLRVVRGGSFYHREKALRCALRIRNNPGNANWDIGLRIVVSPVEL